jgi:phage-related protein
MKLKDEFSGAASGIQSALKGVGTVALGAAGAVAAGSAAMLKLAMDAAPLAGVKAAFESVSGSADTMLAKLREGSLGMVKDADLMKTYNNAAQSVSTTFANDLPNAMGYLSKVSAATGQDMGYMLNSLVTGVGKLSPMILDNLKIQVNLAEANEAYAASIGKTAGELTKQEQQTALMNAVMGKLAANTAAMPDVAGSAAQSMASLSATFANIKDNVGLALIPILQAVLTPLADLATTYGPKVTEWATGFAASLTDVIVPGIANVGGALNELGALLTGSGGDWSTFNELLTSVFGQSVADVVTNAGIMASGIGEKLADIGSALSSHGAEISATATSAWDSVCNAVETAISTVRDVIKTVSDAIAAFWQEHGANITATAQIAWNTISAVIDTTIKNIQKIISDICTAIKTFYDNHSTELRTIAQNTWDSIKLAIDTVINVILGIVRTVMALLRGDWDTAWTEIKNIATTVWDALRTLVETTIDSIKTTVNIVLDEIRVIWNDIWNDIKEKMGLWWDALKNQVMEKFTEVKYVITMKITEALAVVRETVGSWGDAGRDIIVGLADGVRGAIGALMDAIRSTIEGAINWAKGLLGIGSPSTVFLAMGDNAMRAFGQGFAEAAPDVAQVLARSLGGIVAGASSAALLNYYYYGGGNPLIPQTPLGPGGENPNSFEYGGENPLIPQTPLGPGGENPNADDGGWGTGGENPLIPQTPLGPGGENPNTPTTPAVQRMIYNQFGVAVAYRTSGAIEWKEEWGAWPGPDWNNWEFNTQGFQEWYDPTRKQTFVRYARWYRRGGRPPSENTEYGTGSGSGEENPLIPQTPVGPGGENPNPSEPDIGGGGGPEIIPVTPLGPGGENPNADDGGGDDWGTGGGGGWVGTPAVSTSAATGNSNIVYNVLNYNAYRQEPGYADASTQMQLIALLTRLTGV